MDYNQQAGKNFIWLTVAQAAVRVLGLVFYLFLAYKLREQGIGEYNFIGSFVPFWFIVIDFGAGEYLYREWTKRQLPKEEIEKDFNILFTTRFFITVAVFIPFVVINYFINRQIVLPLALFYVSMFVAMFLHLYDLYLQSKNLFRYTAIRQVIEKSVMVLVGAALLYFNVSLTMVFIAMLVSQFASALYYYLRVVSFRIRFVWDWQRCRILFSRGLPFMFIAIFASIYSRIDMVMLRYMNGFDSVGWYGAAYKFLDISSLFSVLFISSIFPLLSELYNSGEAKEKFWQFYYQALRIIFSFGVIVSLSFIAFAPLLVNWFFPASFSPSILALRILMIAQVLMFMSLFFNNLLVIQNKEHKSLLIIIFSAVINIGLNFILIPKFSLYGAAWATVVAEVCNLCILQYFVSWRKNTSILFKMALVICGNALALSLLKAYGLTNNYFADALILLANMLTLFRIGLITREDIKLFINPIHSKFRSMFVSAGDQTIN